jgi:formylglycine-generating enzyme required for sulfatase activity
LVLLAVAGIIVEPFVWTNWFYINQFRPYVLSSPTEQALKPGDSFKECATACPEMIVVPAGSFIMGSPKDEQGRAADEGPQHQVTITKPFAVSKFELTFEHWDVCAKHGDCDPKISDSGWGRGQQPAISVTWEDAHRYVAWLSRMTGKRYRLLSEAEWEYAGRAGTSTRYSFGNDVSALGEYAWFAENSNKQAHSVGEKKPNNFSLHDMQGNAWEWVEDCYHPDYSGAPADGSAWTEAECSHRVARGGSWSDNARSLRIATRNSSTPDLRLSTLGFRVARTLAP